MNVLPQNTTHAAFRHVFYTIVMNDDDANLSLRLSSLVAYKSQGWKQDYRWLLLEIQSQLRVDDPKIDVAVYRARFEALPVFNDDVEAHGEIEWLLNDLAESCFAIRSA